MSVPPRALVVTAAYRFVEIDDGEALRRHLQPPAATRAGRRVERHGVAGARGHQRGAGRRRRAGPSVDAPTLARWLQAGDGDEGRPVMMLDTRNAFEMDAGFFEGASDWRPHKFSDFSDALAEHAAELQGKALVSYGAGGSRCGQAAGATHRRGRCVVVDQPEAIDSHLEGAR